MVKHRPRGRNKSIFDYMKGFENTCEKKEEVVEKKAEASSFYDELARFISEGKAEAYGGAKGVGMVVEKTTGVELSKPLIPTGSVLEEILFKGLEAEDVRCDQSGKCSDGHFVGEVFEDKYGFKRQRGYVNTTRLPIYLDWIIEEASVNKLFAQVYLVKTNRDSLALIPEEYICELNRRYGVIIKNYDKCVEEGSLLKWGGDKDRKKNA